MYEYKATVTNVVDGDTYDLDIDLGFEVYTRQRVRLLGVDTPEVRGELRDFGKMVTRLVAIWLLQGEGFTIRTQQDARGKYGRYLADIYMPYGGGDWLSERLIDKHMAVRYDGSDREALQEQHRQNWAWHQAEQERLEDD